MKYQVKGPLKYLIASIVFGLVGSLFTIRELAKLFAGEKAFLLIFSIGMIPFAVLMFKFYKLYKNNDKDPLAQFLPFYVGYMFSWLGATFAQVGLMIEKDNNENYFIAFLGLLFFIMGLPLFIASLRGILNPSNKNILAVKKMTKFVTIFATILGLSPVLLLIIGMFFAGFYIGGGISLAIFAGLIWLFFKLANRKK